MHKMGLAVLPEDIDKSDGSHPWNMTRPTALQTAYICEFIVPEAIRLIFPEFSYGEWLDYHGKRCHIIRRSATAASGEVTITGEPDTVVPAGTMVATAAVNDSPSVDYLTMEDVTIPESGSVIADIICTQPGTVGNTTKGTVVLLGSRNKGITGIYNNKPITGGTEAESDESMIERILEYDRTQGESFTGSPADYRRWAMSVPGVGDATVISATDDSGLVTIVVTDANGAPANELICEAVYNYIMRPDAPAERPAPVNALLKVVPPRTVEIAISAVVELRAEHTLESVQADFLAQLGRYLVVALDEGEVKYSQVWRVLASVEGANDFKELLIGIKDPDNDDMFIFGTDNIPIEVGELPSISAENLSLTTGTVGWE